MKKSDYARTEDGWKDIYERNPNATNERVASVVPLESNGTNFSGTLERGASVQLPPLGSERTQGDFSGEVGTAQTRPELSERKLTTPISNPLYKRT